MNPHHLELFYFVAKYEGITEAVRKMPYGIQQPAVSGQILQLEKNLGVKLFRRRPFALTTAGDELYNFIYPFFSQLDHVAERLSGEESQHLRLAASAAALTHHLPDVLQQLREDFPGLRLTLKEYTAAEVEVALQKQEVDVAVAVLHRSMAAGIKAIKLIELPLILLAPKNSKVTSFDDLAEGAVGGQILEPLVAVPSYEAAAKVFQNGLAKEKLNWDPTMEVSEIILIEKYVSRGFGFGLAVDIPGVEWPDTVRPVRFPEDFPLISLGALYMGDLKPVAQQFVERAGAHAKELSCI